MIVVATGLRREARIFSGPGLTVIAGGGDATRLEAELDAAAVGASAILSSGVAGALADGLRPGDWVIGAWMAGDRLTPGDGAIDDGWARNLCRLLPAARSGGVYADGSIIANPSAKRALRGESGAIIGDMESHVAARVAARHGIPFAVARVVLDTADLALPPAALVGMRPDGGMAIGAVLRSLLRHPAQLPALMRTARDARRAYRSLFGGYQMLARGGFGLPD